MLSGKGAGKQGPVERREGKHARGFSWSLVSLTPPGALEHELHPQFAPPGDKVGAGGGWPAFCVSCELLVATTHKSSGMGALREKGTQVGCKASTVGRKGDCGRKGMSVEIRRGFNP